MGEADIRVGLAAVARQEGRLEEAEVCVRAAEAIYRRVEHEVGIAAVCLELGRQCLLHGDLSEAREQMEQAFTLACAAEHASIVLLSAAHLAALSAAATVDVPDLFRTYEGRANVYARMEARHLLWRTNGEGADLEAARRLYHGLEAAAPEKYRESMRVSVPLHRSILDGGHL